MNCFSSRVLLTFMSSLKYFISPNSFRPFSLSIRDMKRKAESTDSDPRKTAQVADYCDVDLKRDSNGTPIWPAPENQISAARAFLKEWFVGPPKKRQICKVTWHKDSTAAQKPTLIVPDKDADGLSAGVIVHRALVKLGLDEKLLDVHIVQKGSNVHEEQERRAMMDKKPRYIIVLDQGSRGGRSIIDDPEARSIVIDHHLSDDFPKDAEVTFLLS